MVDVKTEKKSNFDIDIFHI